MEPASLIPCCWPLLKHIQSAPAIPNTAARKPPKVGCHCKISQESSQAVQEAVMMAWAAACFHHPVDDSQHVPGKPYTLTSLPEHRRSCNVWNAASVQFPNEICARQAMYLVKSFPAQHEAAVNGLLQGFKIPITAACQVSHMP